VVLLPLQMHDSHVVETSEGIYRDLASRGVEVIMDDRDERPGVKFNDADLVGIPLRVTVGAKSLKSGRIELKARREENGSLLDISDAASGIIEKLSSLNDPLK